MNCKKSILNFHQGVGVIFLFSRKYIKNFCKGTKKTEKFLNNLEADKRFLNCPSLILWWEMKSQRYQYDKFFVKMKHGERTT